MCADSNRAAGCLYLIGTPIGNLEDITHRAVRVLGEVDQILAEDTRRARVLLDRYAISKPLSSFFEHNEARRLEPVMRALEEGRRIAVITDAGSPGISDPGFRLVREAVARGIPVVSIPGPSAAVTALQVSGLPTDQFLFRGFPPRKSAGRRRDLSELRDYEGTLIYYESSHRLADFLEDAAAELGDRPAAVCRELTKMHEEVVRGTLPELAARFRETEPRGEIAVVIGGHTRSMRKSRGGPDDPDEA
ncbi:MAG: 16S rRNA (cytidine(1402)-2'-O)-methyltransferase [Candidatus Eisenbacteria bacterium]|nr:16S rRNA (cytidine(1402)-2'-O)-methyltransferase [Candidatus Eisenbacteria bacterium]